MDDGTPISLKIERRGRKAYAKRMKLLVGMLTTTGYGVLAGALFEPVLKQQHLQFTNYGMLAFGLVAWALAFYIAPEGELDDEH